MQLNKKCLTILAFIGIFTAFFFLIGQNITGPFTGFNEDNNAVFALAAQNWLKFGFFEMKFGLNIGWLAEFTNQTGFYTHHPSLFLIPTAIGFKLFGVSEFTTRLVPILFSIASLIIFYKLVERVYKNRFISLASTFFMATVPAITFYGKMVDFEIYTLFFSLLTIYYFYKHKDSPSKKTLYCLLGFTFIGNLIGWHFYFTPFVLWILILLDKQYPDRKKLIYLFPAIEFISVLLIALHFYILGGTAAVINFKDAGSARTGRIPIFPWLYKINEEMKINFTPHLYALSVSWIIYTIHKFIQTKKASLELIFLSTSILTILVFSQWAFVHAFGVFYFVAFISIASGRLLFLFFEKIEEFTKSKSATIIMTITICLIHIFYSFGLLVVFSNKEVQTESITMVKKHLSTLNEAKYCIINMPESYSYSGLFSYYLNAEMVPEKKCLDSFIKHAIVFVPKTPEQEKTIDTFLRAGYEPIECGQEICIIKQK